MTPTPREVPVWPHRRDTNPDTGSDESFCAECLRPWRCPSQRYLDSVVAALRAVVDAWDDKWIGCSEMAAPVERLRDLSGKERDA